MLEFWLTTAALSAPLIFAALGGFTSERSGVINIGLEGMMLTACCAVALASPSLGPWGGVAVGIAAASALSLLHWLATQVYRIDHVISGMAINLLAAGGTNFAFGKFSDPNRMGGIPHLPNSFFSVLAFTLPFVLFLYVKFTRGGIRLIATGADADKARLAGINPIKVRFAGLVATGVLTGLGGAALVSYAGTFTDDMTDGRGYIALAALILAGWRPLPALAACLAFGFLTALRIQFQGAELAGITPPSQAWSALPYLATIIALAGFLGKNRTPAGLGKS